jgi:predicted Fe-Mo cluster-binding NifX family protein
MDDVICTAVDNYGRFEVFSKARYLVLVRGGSVIYEELNPALKSANKRPVVARRCVELGARIVLAPHGSLCFPSYLILKRAGVSMYVVRPGCSINGNSIRESVNPGEIIYSSLLAVIERIREVLGHE